MGVCVRVCVCPSHQVLLSAVQRDELLVVLQLPRGTEVGQLVDGAAVLADHPHDVARLDVAMHNAVLPQVVHTSHWRHEGGREQVVVVVMAVQEARKQEAAAAAAVILTHIMQHNEKLVFREAVGVGRLLQDGIEAAAGTVLHHQNLVSGVGLQQQAPWEEKRSREQKSES